MINELLSQLSLHDYKLLNSVRVGDIWHNPRVVGDYLSEFSTGLFFYSGVHGWEMSRRGSLSLIRRGGKYFGVCTWHQIKGYKLDQLGIIADSNKNMVSSSGIIWNKSIETEDWDDANDVVILDFTEHVKRGIISKHSFFSSFANEFLRTGERPFAAIAVGFAQSDQEDDLEEDDEIGARLVHMALRKRLIVGEYQGESYQKEIFRFCSERSGNIELNGMSGSPVFLICGSAGDFYVKYAGIVVRAGNGVFHCLKHTRIRRLVDYGFRSLENSVSQES